MNLIIERTPVQARNRCLQYWGLLHISKARHSLMEREVIWKRLSVFLDDVRVSVQFSETDRKHSGNDYILTTAVILKVAALRLTNLL